MKFLNFIKSAIFASFVFLKTGNVLAVYVYGLIILPDRIKDCSEYY